MVACDSARLDKYIRLTLQIVFGGSALDQTLEHCSPEVTVTHPSHVPVLAQHAAASVSLSSQLRWSFFCHSRVTEKGLLKVPVHLS